MIGAPFSVTKEMVDQLKISLVVHGDDLVPRGPNGEDPYEVPKKLGIYKEVKSTPGLTTSDLISRIVENRLKYVIYIFDFANSISIRYEKRNKAKEAKEVKYLQEHSS